MVTLRRSMRTAFQVLKTRFPQVENAKPSALHGVDFWQPRWLQLESLGILRNFSKLEDLQNIDPELQQLDELLEQAPATPATSSEVEVDLEQLEAYDFSIRLNQVDANKQATPLASSSITDESSSESEEATPGPTAILPALPFTTAGPSSFSSQRQRNISQTSRSQSDQPNLIPLSATSATKPTHRKHKSKRSSKAKASSQPLLPKIPQVGFEQLEAARALFNPHTLEFHPSLPEALKGKLRQQERKRQHRQWSLYHKYSETAQVMSAGQNFKIFKDGRISRPAWMGLKASVDIRNQIMEAINMILDLLPKANSTAIDFVRAIKKPFTEGDMLTHSRGDHWFSIAGHDRNNKEIPKETVFQRDNFEAIEKFFAPGTTLHRLTTYGCKILQTQFPVIAERYQESIDYMAREYGIHAKFGLFFNFCLNSVRKGVKRVFWHFNHKEKCWLVLWEAGFAVELPPGIFIIYPSSLFLHFNVDLANLPIVTTPTGEQPTHENSRPLYFCPCSSHEEDNAWHEAEGRGSMVWFNQASMIQTSELGVSTIKLAKQLDMNVICDTETWEKKDVFPEYGA
ncbi:hypothetical protein FB446DRAFT_707476 [Lentinula raphanica]|nr:hypothetical protein FB446DRAFT_707476 [Lentinula raphanica]